MTNAAEKEAIRNAAKPRKPGKKVRATPPCTGWEPPPGGWVLPNAERLAQALEASQELLVTSLHYEGNEYINDTENQIKENRRLLGPPRC